MMPRGFLGIEGHLFNYALFADQITV